MPSRGWHGDSLAFSPVRRSCAAGWTAALILPELEPTAFVSGSLLRGLRDAGPGVCQELSPTLAMFPDTLPGASEGICVSFAGVPCPCSVLVNFASL